jgi:predicted DNA-binding protein
MANLQVKNVPAELHRRLRRLAKHQGRTLREIVLEAVRRDVEHAEFEERLKTRRPVDLGRPAARAVEEARAERAEELGW